MEKWALILLVAIVTQVAGDSTTGGGPAQRFCCNDEKSWLDGSRRCDGTRECPGNVAEGEVGGEDEEFCGSTARASWCDDTVKYPAETEMEAPELPGTPLWLIIVIVAGVVLVIAVIIALVVLKIKKSKGDPVSTMEM